MLNLSGWRVRFVAAAVTLVAGLELTMPLASARADVVRNTEAWVLSELNVQPAWVQTQGRGVLVAVIDSGVDPDVSDLIGNVYSGPNFSGVNTPPSSPGWGVHGTWMASLIAGHGHGAGDDSGIIGVAPQAKILSIRVITDPADPNYAAYQRQSAGRGQRELATAIRYAVSHGAGVISMSLGYGLPSLPVRAALQDAYNHNVVVVASAGNSGDGQSADDRDPTYSFPANYPGVLAVAAVNSAARVAGFSSRNLSVQVAAPGFKVPAQGNDGQYWLVSGTSPACALTAGVVALIKSKFRRLSDPQVIAAITSSTSPSTRPKGGYNQQIGFGVVNAAAALAAAGRIAKAGQRAPGGVTIAHFGGGPAAIPAPPVAPRSRTALVLYCLLGAACLLLVALASARMLALREIRAAGQDGAAPAAGLPRSLPGVIRGEGPPPGRHAAPRGRGQNPARPS